MFIPILRANHDVVNAHLLQLTMQPVAKRTGFVATMNFLGLGELFPGPFQKGLGRELLGGLRSSVVHLADHPVALGMHVDAQLDALGFGEGLCWSCFVGIGDGFCFFHITLV